MAPQNDIGTLNRNLVLGEILRQRKISRSAIGARLQLNNASVSRITRDLIDAGLVRESGPAESDGKPGRRFVGLSARGAGGYILGIGLNAFRQSVTLADLENNKIAEWVSPNAPSSDGEAFIRSCIEKAAELVALHVKDRDRLFGVGIAVAADLDKTSGTILRAPTFGWNDMIPVSDIVTEILQTPLVLEVPSLSINVSEGDFGVSKDIGDTATLHCSLGFGMAVRKTDANGMCLDFGRVLTRAVIPDGSNRKLDAVCGGISILNEMIGLERVSKMSDTELGINLVELVQKSPENPVLTSLLTEKGRMTAQFASLTLDLIRPELLLLAGPLTASREYVAGFHTALNEIMGSVGSMPEIKTTDLTPTGASRWLALRAHVAMGNLDLHALKRKDAA